VFSLDKSKFSNGFSKLFINGVINKFRNISLIDDTVSSSYLSYSSLYNFLLSIIIFLIISKKSTNVFSLISSIFRFIRLNKLDGILMV
jgi:hypothetical protein